MTIHSLTIENLRGFAGKHEIVFRDKNVAAFVGVNGSGKSTVLEAVIVALQNLVRLSDRRNNNGAYVLSVDDVSKSYLEGSIALTVVLRSDLDARLKISIPFPDSLSKSVKLDFNNFDDKDWLRNAVVNKLQLPVLSAYEPGLPIEQSEGFYDEIQEKLGREQTYFDGFSTRIDFTNLTHWLEDLVNIQNSEAVKKRDFDYALPAIKAINTGLTSLWEELENTGYGVGKVELLVEAFDRTLTFVKNERRLKFDQLSSGEKLIIGLSLDLMYRCISANGHLDNPLNSTGIVLIDEIELHLHPRWQANIIKALTTTFPNIQFIISTHAPLVINQLKSEQVFVLRDTKIVPAERLMQTYGMDISSVVSLLMGAPTRPKEVESKFDEIKRLLDDPKPANLDRVSELLDKLRTIISPNDLDLIELANILSIEKSEVDL
ncbi:MAG: AAA family ATPase [Lewinella sp.]